MYMARKSDSSFAFMKWWQQASDQKIFLQDKCLSICFNSQSNYKFHFKNHFNPINQPMEWQNSNEIGHRLLWSSSTKGYLITKISMKSKLSPDNCQILVCLPPENHTVTVQSWSKHSYSKHPHIRTYGLRTPGWNLANKAPFLKNKISLKNSACSYKMWKVS